MRIVRIVCLWLCAAVAATTGATHSIGEPVRRAIDDFEAWVSAETCRQMRSGVAAGQAMSDAMGKAMERILPPTAGERALLSQYSAELQTMMMRADGDENWEDAEVDESEDVEEYREEPE